MRPIKLYYDSFPGKKLCYDEIVKKFGRKRVDPDGRYNEWNPGNYHFHDILNELSIPWEWTNDPNQGIVFVDAESTSCVPELLDLVSNKFSKFILGSLGEGLFNFVEADLVLDHHPNIFLLDSTVLHDDSLKEKYPRYLTFPNVVFRKISPWMTTIFTHSERLLEQPEKKKYTFNHLSRNCRIEKFISHFYLKYKFDLQDCLYSFNTPNGLQQKTLLDFFESTDLINQKEKQEFIDKITSPFERCMLEQDEYHHSISTSFHPEHLYADSCISIVTESIHSTRSALITEKIIQPIANAHPVIVNGGQYYNKTLTEQLGFELFTEMFDYSFDNEANIFARTESLARQLKNFDRSTYLDNFKTVIDKVQYNKNLLANKNSSLYVKYRQLMLEYIDRYYSFEV